MNWFKHDTAAIQDAKLKKLIIRHGAIGYAIYFHCLELIAGDVSETNITFELEHDSEIIAENLHIRGDANKSGIAIVEEVMETIIGLGLLQESQSHIFCFKLLKRMDLSMTSNPQFREMIKRAKENHDSVMIGHDSVMINHDSVMLEEQEEKRREEIAREDTLPTVATPSKQFKKPTLEEVQAFFDESRFTKDPENFFNYWESVDWTKGNGRKIKDWKAAARNYVKMPWAPSAPPKKAPVQLCPECGKPLFDELCMNKDCPRYA